MACCCILNRPPFKTSPSSTTSAFTGSGSSKIFKITISERSASSRRRSRATTTSTTSNSKILCGVLPIDPWSPAIESHGIATHLFATSLFPYLGFLYYITKSKTAPKLTLFGFYFLLAFVGATIPAGIYAKVRYGASLSNVDWLHGSAESLLTLTNLFILLGLREALRKIDGEKKSALETVSEIEEEQSSL